MRIPIRSIETYSYRSDEWLNPAVSSAENKEVMGERIYARVLTAVVLVAMAAATLPRPATA
ncbi:MAG TPA: hypothetical protein VG408_07710, partial [Actinomycetota bacterium]|nr:hypothetical protein [Actinomycetota bacterium]